MIEVIEGYVSPCGSTTVSLPLKACDRCVAFLQGEFPHDESEYEEALEMVSLVEEFENKWGHIVGFIVEDRALCKKPACSLCKSNKTDVLIQITTTHHRSK